MRTLRTTNKASRRSYIAYGVENEHSDEPLGNVDDNEEHKARTCETIAEKSALDLAEFYSKRQKSVNQYRKKISQFTKRPCEI